jgi:hypothetical protein
LPLHQLRFPRNHGCLTSTTAPTEPQPPHHQHHHPQTLHQAGHLQSFSHWSTVATPTKRLLTPAPTPAAPHAFHHQLEHRHCLFITSGSHRRLSHLNNNSYRATASSPSTSPSTAAFSHQLQQLPPPGLLFSLLQHSSNTFFLLKPNLFQQHHSNHLQGALPCMVVPPLQASRPCSSAAHLFPQPRTTKLETSPSCLLP